MRRVNLNEFPDVDALSMLRNAVDYLRTHPNTTLVIPAGRYILHDDKAYQQQYDLMHGRYTDNPYIATFNGNFDYVTGLDFTGLKDVVIEADGATFLIDGMMQPIAIQHCQNVTVIGLTLDMVRRAYSKGVIVRCDKDSFDVQFPDQKWISEQMPAPRMCVVGRRERRMVATIHADVESSASKERINEDTVRFFRQIAPKLLGEEIYVFHTWHTCPAVLIYEAEHTLLIDFKIHSHCGMGIVGHRSSDILLKRCMIVPAPGSAVSTNTDATHFTSCKGLLRCENCSYEGQGDDAINVHGFYQTIEKHENGECVLCVNVRCSTHSLKFDHPDVGDELELVRKKNLAVEGGLYTVKAVELDHAAWKCRVTLDRPLPDDCVGEYLCDITQLPRLEFVGCHIRNHFARAMLLRTHGALIEGCSFESSILTAIHVSAECYWHESAASEDVVIRGNRIMHCGELDGVSADEVGGVNIYVGADHPDRPVHRNIRIENNLIDCPNTRYAIRANFVDGLTVRNNQTNGAILIENCINVVE